MNNDRFELKINEYLVNTMLNNYDYKIMAAKDSAIVDFIVEVSNKLPPIYNKLCETNKILIIAREGSIYENAPLLLIEKLDKEELPTTFSIDEEDCIIKITGEAYTKENGKNKREFNYEVVFDEEMCYIMVKDDENALMVDLETNYIDCNTFSENETDAILYTLALVVSAFEENSIRIINLSDYRKCKN